MKLTTKQLKQIIKEELSEMMGRGNYRAAQKASNAPFKDGTLKYYQEVADILGGELSPSHLGIPVRNNGPIFTRNMGANGVIEFSFTAFNWPAGQLQITAQIDEDGNKDHSPVDWEAREQVRYNELSINFPVTGIPSLDAEFIEKLTNLRLSKFREIARVNGQQRSRKRYDKSFVDMIMPGWPWDYIQ